MPSPTYIFDFLECIITKVNNRSNIRECDDVNPNAPTMRINVNPVKNPYIILWDQYRNAKTYLELINSLFCEVNPIPVKEAMNMLGMASGACRMPLTKMSADNVARLMSAMQRLGMPVSVVD